VISRKCTNRKELKNAAKTYSTQLRKSETYKTLEPIIALTITDFIMFDELSNYVSYWHLRDKEQFIKYSDDIELIFIELPKFTKTDTELVTVRENTPRNLPLPKNRYNTDSTNTWFL